VEDEEIKLERRQQRMYSALAIFAAAVVTAGISIPIALTKDPGMAAWFYFGVWVALGIFYFLASYSNQSLRRNFRR
jgi:fatty acid desaturase